MSPLKLHTWNLNPKIVSAYGTDKQDAINTALVGIPNAKREELRQRLTTNPCTINETNLRK